MQGHFVSDYVVRPNQSVTYIFLCIMSSPKDKSHTKIALCTLKKSEKSCKCHLWHKNASVFFFICVLHFKNNFHQHVCLSGNKDKIFIFLFIGYSTSGGSEMKLQCICRLSHFCVLCYLVLRRNVLYT